jgi:hypothetical protein
MVRAEQAEQRCLGELTGQLDEAAEHVAENAAIAGLARVDVERRADRAATLRSELARRAPAIDGDQPWSTPLQSDVAPAERGLRGPVATAVADHDSAVKVATVQPQPGGPLDGDRQRDQVPVAARVGEDQDQSRRQSRSPLWDVSLDGLRTALADAEQQMAVIAYVVQRYGTVRQRWQDSADTLNRELARIAEGRPYVSIAETNVASERQVAARIDELRGALDRSRMGRPALRGAAREDLDEELNGLLQANPALRFDPVLRQERWNDIVERATMAEQTRMTEVRVQLEEAMANVAENTSLVTSAASRLAEQGERSASLRAEIEARTATAGPVTEDAETVAGPRMGSDRQCTTTKSAVASEEVTGTGSEAETDGLAAGAPIPLRHEQMQLPVVDPPAITEGLGG